MKAAFLIVCLLISSEALAGSIISLAGGGARTITATKDYYRDVTGFADNRGSSGFTERIHCRIFRYGPAGRCLPLVVQFICWGGSIDGTEASVQYEDMMNDPFMSLVIMPEYNGGDDNPSNWYWGNQVTIAGQKRSVPWVHNAVIDIINDIKQGKLDSILCGNTVDTNRIYAMGSSIGGTAAAQIGIKHPEIFAAVHSHAGWTRYYGTGNHFFSDSRGCLAFADLIGGVSHTGFCTVDSSVLIQGNADQKYLPISSTLYPVFQYTDLNWYFAQSGSTWNYRDPGFESPFMFITTGSQDDPANQGDNLVPALDSSRRGMMYYRVDAGHAAGGIYVHWNWLRNFRKNRSFIAFTNRTYDDFQNFSGNGYLNDLSKHGWAPDSIIDEPHHYHVKLTGTGSADVTLRNLQKLQHTPGTTYAVSINGSSAGNVVADRYGLITIPHVENAATIDLVASTSIRFDKRSRGAVITYDNAISRTIYSLAGKKMNVADLGSSNMGLKDGVYIEVIRNNNSATSLHTIIRN